MEHKRTTVDPTVEFKTCTGCNRTLQAKHFYLRTDTIDGISSRCRECCTAQVERSKEKHRKIAAAKKERQRRMKEALIEYDQNLSWQEQAELYLKQQHKDHVSLVPPLRRAA